MDVSLRSLLFTRFSIFLSFFFLQHHEIFVREVLLSHLGYFSSFSFVEVSSFFKPIFLTVYLCLLLENDGAFSSVEFHFLRLENCSVVSRRFCLVYFVFVLRKRNFFREASSFFT